jgi:hypothetical protein
MQQTEFKPVYTPYVKQPRNIVVEKEKRIRTNKQRNANRRRGNVAKELADTIKAHGFKADAKMRSELKHWRNSGLSNDDFFKLKKSEYLKTHLKNLKEAMKMGRNNKTIKLNKVAVKNTKKKEKGHVQFNTPIVVPSVVPSGHVLAGKKAATSLKGKKWLEDIRAAKRHLNSILEEAGATEASQQKDARKYASILRKNPKEAEAFAAQIVSSRI